MELSNLREICGQPEALLTLPSSASLGPCPTLLSGAKGRGKGLWLMALCAHQSHQSLEVREKI
jgi:hypothetical protein